MYTSEKGFTYLPVLFFTTLILLYLIGSSPRMLTSKQSIQNERGKYQAERNAEAGVYFAVEDWNQVPAPFIGRSYVLSSGTAFVTVRKQSEDRIEIISVGSYELIFKDQITAIYDTKQSQWMSWTR